VLLRFLNVTRPAPDTVFIMYGIVAKLVDAYVNTAVEDETIEYGEPVRASKVDVADVV